MKDDDGFSAPEMKGKHSLKASVTSELAFQDCVFKRQNSTWVKGLRGPFSVLTMQDMVFLGVPWGCYGVLHSAKTYSLSRIQFGVSIASFQLVQNKLADVKGDYKRPVISISPR